MRPTRTLAALVLTGALAGCYLPGGDVLHPPVFDEATHGDSDVDFISEFPTPSTLVGSLGPADSADYYSSQGPAGSTVRVRCWLTSGWADVSVRIGAGPAFSEGTCNGLPITLALTDGGYGVDLTNDDSPPLTYRIVVRAS